MLTIDAKNLTPAAARAVAKYGELACSQAAGWAALGYGSAGILHGCKIDGFTFRTVGQVDAAVAAGQEIAAHTARRIFG